MLPEVTSSPHHPSTEVCSLAKYDSPAWFGISARLLFAALALLTSIYCLLAYIPDTYFAFIQAPFQPWLVALIRFHPYWYFIAFVLLSVSLIGDYRGGKA